MQRTGHGLANFEHCSILRCGGARSEERELRRYMSPTNRAVAGGKPKLNLLPHFLGWQQYEQMKQV